MAGKPRAHLKSFWTNHMDNRLSSNTGRSAYCRTHSLSLNQMVYWERQLSSMNAKVTPKSGSGGVNTFAQVISSDQIQTTRVNSPAAFDGTIRIRFPSGPIVEICNGADPIWISGLVKALAGEHQ